MIGDYYEAVPIHKRPELIDEAIQLINDEWPRSRCSRLWSLGSSRDELPTSLIVTFRNKATEKAEKVKQNTRDRKAVILEETKIINDMFFNRQNINMPKLNSAGEPIEVLAHLRLLPVPSDEKSCFIESMVVAHEYRGKGIGSFLIKEAEKYCEQVLHLKHVYLNTIDSGEFYMKLGFELTDGIAIFGQGAINDVSKKIFLKKSLNYVECEEEEENDEDIHVYDSKKDMNYAEQCKIENDVIISGFAAKPNNDKVIAESLSVLFDTSLDHFKYYYSFEHLNRVKDERSFYYTISFKTKEAKLSFMENGRKFGVLCYQNLFEIYGKVVDEYENALLSFEDRLTKLNLIIKKELINLLEENIISGWEFADNRFYATQDGCKINVYNLGILELIKMRDDLDEEPESIGWETNSDELEKELKALENFKKSLRRQSTQNDTHYKWLSQNSESFDSGIIVEGEEDESANELQETINEQIDEIPIKPVKKMDKVKRNLILQHCIVEKKENTENKINEWLQTSDFTAAETNDEKPNSKVEKVDLMDTLKPKSSLDSLMDFFSIGFGSHP